MAKLLARRELGYQRAWDAIRDSNISTFMAGVFCFCTAVPVQ